MGFEESKLAVMKIAFFAGIGFWGAKVVLDSITANLYSHACNYLSRKEAEKKYKEAMRQEEECVAIARTVEKK